VAVGNEPLGDGLEDGEFKGKTGITYLADAGMHVEDFVKKSPVAVLAKRFNVI
jgi:hypothetical protein